MNFESLKLGFQSYLKQISESTGQEYALTNSDVSIFMYADEFKDYMSNELNDTSIFSMNINEILDMEIEDGKLISQDEIEGETISDEESQEGIVAGLLNEIMNQDSVKSLIDSDGNEELSADEIKSFVNTLAGFDENSEDLTLEDIIGAINAINDNEFLTEAEIEMYKPQEDKSETFTPYPNSISIPPQANGGKPIKYDPVQPKTIENMTEEELNSELSKAQSDLSDKQNTLSSILDGSDPAIKALQETVDSTYETYLEQLELVDEDLAEQVDDLNTQITDKQSQIDDKDSDIFEQESTVSDCESALSNATSSRENLESTLAQLNSASTSDMNDEQKANLQSKIQTAQAKLESAKQAESKAQEDLDKAEEKLEQLNEEKTTLQDELDSLNESMTELEEEIAQKYPQIQEYLDAHNQAKEDYASQKANATQNAKAQVTLAQNYVGEVQAALNDAQNEKDSKELALEPEYDEEAGNRLAQAASTVRGTTGMCLGGVNDSIEEVYGQRLSFTSAYQAADALRGNIPGYENLASNFVEVEVERSELSNLPAGAIVVWDNNQNGGGSNVSAAGKIHGHISIALGDGRESSDHITNQSVNRDAEYTVFYPVS